MNDLIVTVVGGLLVIIVAGLLGFGTSASVVIRGGQRVRKTGKWMIIIAVLMIVGGLVWASHNSPAMDGLDLENPDTMWGLVIAGYGLLLLLTGKVVAWFQRP